MALNRWRRRRHDDDPPQVADASRLAQLAAEAEELGTHWAAEDPAPAGKKRHWWQGYARGTNTIVTGNAPGSVSSQGMGGL